MISSSSAMALGMEVGQLVESQGVANAGYDILALGPG